MKKIFVLSALICASMPLMASAAPVFAGTAEKIIKVADLPDIPELEVSNEYGTQTAFLDVGYCYKQFQLMFIPIWNYNEHYCGYVSDDAYTDTSKSDLLDISRALDVDTSWDNDEPKISMTERVWGKVGLVALLAIFLVYQMSKGNRNRS